MVADTINRTSSFFLLIMMTMLFMSVVMVPFIEFPAVGAYPNNVLTPTPTPQHHEYYRKTLFEHHHHRLHSSYIPTKFASYTVFASPATRRGSSTSIELVRGGSIDDTITTSKNIVSGRSNSINNHNRSTTTTALFAFPQIPWFSFPNKENNNPDNYNDNTLNEFGELLVQGDQAQKRNQNKPKYQPSNHSNLTNEAESTMHRAVKMMEEHRRSQEAAERTSAIMDELASMTVVGRSKAGPSSSGGGGGGGGGGILGFGDDDAKNRGGGVKVTFNGQQRPISVNVDSKFLSSLMMMSASASSPPPAVSTKSSSSSSSSSTTTAPTSTITTTSATEELNQAIIDAMQDGYEKSGKLMEEKLKGLYDQLGLPKRDEK